MEQQEDEGERDKLLQRDPPGVAIQYGGPEDIGDEEPRDVPRDVIGEQPIEMSFLVRVIKTMAMASIYICLVSSHTSINQAFIIRYYKDVLY